MGLETFFIKICSKPVLSWLCENATFSESRMCHHERVSQSNQDIMNGSPKANGVLPIVIQLPAFRNPFVIGLAAFLTLDTHRFLRAPA